MINKISFFVFIILNLSCNNQKTIKKNDEVEIFNIILKTRNEINKIEGGKIEYFLIDNNEYLYKNEYIDSIKNEDIKKRINVKILPENSVKNLYKLDKNEIQNITKLKILDKKTLDKIIKKTNDKNNIDSIIYNYDRYFKNDYICVEYIYFNYNKTKAVVKYRTGTPYSSISLVYFFEKNNYIWKQKELLFY